MILNIKVHLDYELTGPSSILLHIEAANQPDQTVQSANINAQYPYHFTRVTGDEGVGERIWLQAEGRFTCNYSATVSVSRPVPDFSRLSFVPPHLLPGDAVKYLMGSRFSPSDEFHNFVISEFGHTQGGERIQTMLAWIKRTIEYVAGSSDAQTSALDTFVQRRGVCRDFAHLIVTLARASSIPARMVSVYALGIKPSDFHAVAEVFLDGAWHMVDATGMAQAGGMARIGVGRDAADIPFMSVFGGPAMMLNQSVTVEQVIAQTGNP